MDRRAGSGRQRTITTKENKTLTENLICSQEDNPGSHMSPREVEKNTSISCTSVRQMIKRRGLKQFERLKTTMMSYGMQEKRTKRARALEDRFRKSCSVKKCVWQDEKDFTLDVPLNSLNIRAYGFENKDNIQDNPLFYHTNRQSQKVMVSACVTCKGATKSFFVNDEGLKVNSKTYIKKHLKKELLPEVNRIIRDSASSHRANIVQDFLKKKIGQKVY